MKKLIVPILCAVTLIIGCTTTKVVTQNPDGTFTTNVVKRVDSQRAQKVAELVTRSAGRIATVAAKRPQLKAEFAVAAQAIDILILNNNYDPAALRECLAKIHVTTDDEIYLIGASVLDVYELLVSEVLSQQLDKVEWLRPILTGIRNGLLAASQANLKRDGTTNYLPEYVESHR